jgi:uncharacterized protein
MHGIDNSAMRFFFLFAIALFLCGSVCAGDNQQALPEFHRRVNDLSGTLSVDETRDLETKLAQFEQETSNQIVILLVQSLEGQSLEDYSIRVAEKNKFGKKERNNGVLVVVAKDEHGIRIEVGYGLEGALTDALSSQIIRNIIGPKFRQGDYAGGLNDGVEAIIAVTKGEFKGDGGKQRSGRRGFNPIAIFILFIILNFFFRIFMTGRRHIVGSKGYSSNYPWWWGGFGGGGSGGGFGGGGFGGGGGGFSGGGGSFGGGGASGSW